jgi:hypothetical protein
MTLTGSILKNRSSSFFDSLDMSALSRDLEQRVLDQAMRVSRLVPLASNDKKSVAMMISHKRPKKRLAKKILKRAAAENGSLLFTARACAAYRAIVRSKNRRARREWKALSKEEQDKRITQARWDQMTSMAGLSGVAAFGLLRTLEVVGSVSQPKRGRR